jgi:flagellar motor switch protein FliN/FliY
MAEESLTPEGQEPETNTPPSADAGDEPASAAGMAEEALEAAQEALSGMSDAGRERSARGGHGASPLDLPAFSDPDTGAGRHGIDLLKDVNLQVKIELGRTRMLVEDVLRLGQGSVVELDKVAGDPVDVYVNDRPVARGEVLVLNDNFCVRISEILKPAGDAAEE